MEPERLNSMKSKLQELLRDAVTPGDLGHAPPSEVSKRKKKAA